MARKKVSLAGNAGDLAEYWNSPTERLPRSPSLRTASRVARTASIAISNIFTPMLLHAADAGGIDEMIFNHTWFMRGVYTYRGSICNIHLARKFNLGYKDLNLLMAARF